MKKFFTSIFNQLTAYVTAIKFIRMWNNQLDLLYDGKMYMFPFPAVFIEFDSSTIQQLGEGRQLFDPLTFKLHICDWKLDAGNDTTFEQNLDIYDIKDLVFQAIQKFQPGLTDLTNPVGSCIRIAETQDYSHKGVYHYIQTYRTTLVEELMTEPVGGGEFDPKQATQTSGVLIVGEVYEILSVGGGFNFTNVGASANTVGVIFHATGTTPTAWGTGSVQLYHSKAEIVPQNESGTNINTYQFPAI